MDKKYYFYCYVKTFEVGRYDFIDLVSDNHPFWELEKLRKREVQPYERRYEYSLLSFSEISKDEYDLYIKLNKDY